jgi:aspartyl-tRNA(Asn)/glutamyl-tRNA(Gln) amidotransferase subunit A
MIERTATELVHALHRGDISAAALTGEFLTAIRNQDGSLHAFLHIDEASALEQAHAVDRKRQRGEPIGRLAGLPVALKDNLCVQGTVTTCASRILASFVPPYDAHVVEQLRNADAVLLGKTNLDEFAMGSSGENSAFGPTRNPWDLERVPGGSSSGSAAAVAAGLAPVALGSDTGGSIRLPAAFCGITGLKPTYGLVSRRGLVAYGSSLDQIGPLGRSVADVALVLGVIAGHDRRDSTSVAQPVPDYLATLHQPRQSLRIGLVRELFGEGIAPDVEKLVRDAIDVYRQLGAQVIDVNLPHLRHAIATYYLVATAEASSNLARYDGVHFGHRAAHFDNLTDMVARSRDEGFGPEVKRRIMLGTYALSSGYKDAYYIKALQVRRLIKNEFDQAFQRCDVLLSPTAPTPAFKLGERLGNPLQMYLLDVCTLGCNLAGIPGISIPCGFTAGGLPVGLQLAAPAFAEGTLLRVAKMYQDATDWHHRRPP